LKSDNFHDFFTEYVPYGEECVLYFEERDFYRRFPNASRRHGQVSAPGEKKDITIPSRSGLSWKVSEEDEQEPGSDVSRQGPHMSSVEAHKVDQAQLKTADARA